MCGHCLFLFTNKLDSHKCEVCSVVVLECSQFDSLLWYFFPPDNVYVALHVHVAMYATLCLKSVFAIVRSYFCAISNGCSPLQFV